MPVVHPSRAPPLQVTAQRRATALSSISRLNAQLARSASPFLHGDDPTISDLLCYGELGQLSKSFLDLYDFSPHPSVVDWMARMETLPHFERVHQDLLNWLP